MAAGIGVSFVAKEVVWYGAVVVGGIEVARGLLAMHRARLRARGRTHT